MSDNTKVALDDHSKEHVAFLLYKEVRVHDDQANYETMDDILNLYAECLKTVKFPKIRSRN
jgi:hypothetical protein